MTKDRKERIQYLLAQLVEHKASIEQKQMLFALLDETGESNELESIVEELMVAEPQMTDYNSTEWEPIIKSILEEGKVIRKQSVVRSLKPWRWIAAAAILAGVVLAGYWVFIRGNNGEGLEILADAPQEERFRNDVSPADQGVILTLGNGEIINLDSAAIGKIALEGNTEVIKEDGALIYNDDEATTVVYNRVSTEKGRIFQLQLPDGTRVWLDAMSSIRYPTAFKGNERAVEITGQVYMEVARDEKKPFRVSTKNQVVEVLGTEFNINAYGAEVMTTLLEGSVDVRAIINGDDVNYRESVRLVPGQQARLMSNDHSAELRVTNDVDIEEVMAWKNGRFQFSGSSMEEIMVQLGRWYDIEVEFKNKISGKFVAKISRDLPVSRLLKLLEMTKEVKFIIEGKRVIVMK